VVRVTDLGRTVGRWVDSLLKGNAVVLSRHLAYALNCVQLRNPTVPGQEYDNEVTVFPARFIWQAMDSLGGKISSDEINRGILWTKNHNELLACIQRIRDARASGNLDDIGAPCVTETAQNDRIIPWIAIASFGWTLIADKENGYYSFQPWARQIIREALMVQVRHRDYPSVADYIQAISNAACLPPDLRS
jgi:hypothetical protein